MKPYLIALILLLLCAARAGAQDPPIGSIKLAEGDVGVTRGGSRLAATPGTLLFQGDVVDTGPDSRAGLILRDDTTLSMGPESRLELDQYLFEPRQNKFSVLFRMLRGTFVYLSGVIAKLAPDAIQLETPDSTIAVRGTRLLIKVEGA